MISNFLLSLIVFVLPTQLGFHFWPDFSRVSGLKVDYLSPTIYFIDILIFGYILLNLKDLLISLKNKYQIYTFFVLIIFNIYFSYSPFVSSLVWLKVCLYLAFFVLIRNDKKLWLKTRKMFFFSTILIIVLELLQFLNQGSLGGILYWFGERYFTYTTPNIGKIYLFHNNLIRPISTFSHANSLSGYLLVVFFLLKYYKEDYKIRILVFLGILLTFSKIAILASSVVILVNKKPIILFCLIGIFTLLQIFMTPISVPYSYISDRLQMLALYQNIPLIKLITGVGIGSYIPYISQHIPPSMIQSSTLQPVHNSILLLLAEAGVFGLIFVMVQLRKLKFSKKYAFILLLIVLLTGSVDHYWLTLVQNRLILLFALALIV